MERQWTPDEKRMVDAAFLALCELHRQQVSDALTRIYYRVLAQFPAEMVVEAMEKSITMLKWFPKPVELMDILNGDPEEQAINAWMSLQKAVGCVGTNRSVLFEDPKTTAVIKFFGGWEEIGNWSVAYIGKRRDEFIEAYKIVKNPPPTEKLIGRGEDPRLLNGYPNLNPWAIVRRDGEIVNMRRVLASNGSEVLDLPELQYALPESVRSDETDGGELVPVSTFLPKLMGAFK
jgi:hypothetical protein